MTISPLRPRPVLQTFAALATVFNPARADGAKTVLQVFVDNNADIMKSFTKGVKLTAYQSGEETYVLAVPNGQTARLYAVDQATGKAVSGSQAQLDALTKLYNEKADANSGKLMAQLRGAFGRIHDIPYRAAGAQSSEDERDVLGAIRALKNLGCDNAESFAFKIAATGQGKDRSALQLEIEDEIIRISNAKRRDLPGQISEAETALQAKFDTATLTL